MTDPKADNCRWMQTCIVTLAVLSVLCVVPVSWLVVQASQVHREREAARAIEEMGGWVRWSEPSAPAWLRSVLGDDLFITPIKVVLSDTEVSDTGLELCEGLNQLRELELTETSVTDAGLKRLAGLSQLTTLSLWRTRVADEGLDTISGLSRLEVLSLDETDITDAGLKRLTGLKQLQQLGLTRTKITDAGVEALAELTQLEWLNIEETKLSNAGVARLRKALPDCQIYNCLPDAALPVIE